VDVDEYLTSLDTTVLGIEDPFLDPFVIFYDPLTEEQQQAWDRAIEELQAKHKQEQQQ
jgi:hypothetical protein